MTQAEFDSGQYSHIDMTNEPLTWDPQDPCFSEQETFMTDLAGNILGSVDYPLDIHSCILSALW